jgi:phosphatidylinositol glycan class B
MREWIRPTLLFVGKMEMLPPDMPVEVEGRSPRAEDDRDPATAPAGSSEPVEAPWWRGIHAVALVALVVRIALAMSTDQVHHPDEIFQYLEQGHRIAFGYGSVPWELRLGLRSLAIPLFISFWLFACKALHLGEPEVYMRVVRVVFCVISISLVYATYVAGRRLFSERAGRIAALLACGWYELLCLAPKPTPEVLSMYALMGALACVAAPKGARRPLALGALAALSVCLRVQYALALVPLGVFVLREWKPREQVGAFGVFALVALGFGLIDRLTWGRFFGSYLNYIAFNKSRQAQEVFGQAPWSFFLKKLVVGSAGALPLAAALSTRRLRRTWLPLACAGGILLLHSLVPHKEYRFVVGVVPLLLLLAAATIDRFAERWEPLLAPSLAGLGLISLAGLAWRLPREENLYSQPILGTSDLISAYAALRGDPSLRALYNEGKGEFLTPGYYYLHRDVPIYHVNQIRNRGLPPLDVRTTVSHILCKHSASMQPGFVTMRTFGEFDVRRQLDAPAHYEGPRFDTRELLFARIETP